MVVWSGKSPAQITRNATVARPLDLPRAADTEAVGVDEQGDHGLRMMRCAFPAVLAVPRVEKVEVHFLDAVEDEPRQVVLRKPVRNRGCHQVELVTIRSDEVIGDGPIEAIAHVQVVGPKRVLPDTSQIVRRLMQQALIGGKRWRKNEPIVTIWV